MLEKGFIEKVKIFLARIKIRHIQANIRIQNHEQIQGPIFHRRCQKWSTNQNWIFSILSKAMQFIFKFLNFIWRSNRFWINNQTFCSKLFFQDLCKFLCPHTVFSDFFASTLLALLREKILLFADMTNPNFLATRQKMIIHRNWTAITLRNMTTVMANYACMIAFFVDKDSDFFLFSEVFSHPLFKKFRKSLVEFFGHIYQIDFLISVIKKFVVLELGIVFGKWHFSLLLEELVICQHLYLIHHTFQVKFLGSLDTWQGRDFQRWVLLLPFLIFYLFFWWYCISRISLDNE